MCTDKSSCDDSERLREYKFSLDIIYLNYIYMYISYQKIFTSSNLAIIY